MMKLDKERQGKVNHIISDVNELLSGDLREEEKLSCISSILCELDTDIAIEVMKDFGKAGEHQAMAIKVNYGY